MTGREPGFFITAGTVHIFPLDICFGLPYNPIQYPKNLISSYLERRRDWPYEARQPAFPFECSGVNSCRIFILRDKINSLFDTRIERDDKLLFLSKSSLIF